MAKNQKKHKFKGSNKNKWQTKSNQKTKFHHNTNNVNNIIDTASADKKNEGYKARSSYPIPFPPSLWPQINQIKGQSNNIFLRNDGNHKDAFQKALETSYQGFECDIPSKHKSELFPHGEIEDALETMNQHNYFRTDVTQPFGLGTKCAKTYVTRCLLGDEGTTYKYLGLRMFSHPWQNNTIHLSLNKAFQTIHHLNSLLIQRTKIHLQTLDQKRQINHGNNNNNNHQALTTIRGRPTFDITLINRMVDSTDLKMEPMAAAMSAARSSSSTYNFQNSNTHMNKFTKTTKTTQTNQPVPRTSVSWHADSCLEHYSSIAVYHTISNTQKNYNHMHKFKSDTIANNSKSSSPCTSGRQWAIALRVSHDAEGPNASSAFQSQQTNSLSNNLNSDLTHPPITISLPSGSAYYLLEDFNHHHQHAVLAEDIITSNRKQNKETASKNQQPNPGIRYSSTHRLLRQGHNVFTLINKCIIVCSNFHKKGIKVWKAQQHLLTEIESEWLRQFFIQGQNHKHQLWHFWEQPILKLFHYWTLLEAKTKNIIDHLRFAAEERIFGDDENHPYNHQKTTNHNQNTNSTFPTRAERKLKDKRKKAYLSIQDILKRNDGSSNTFTTKSNITALTSLYEPFAQCLRDRADKRNHWANRENDPVFHSMEPNCRPMPFPVKFSVLHNHTNTKISSSVAISSVPLNDNSKEEFTYLGYSPLGGRPQDLHSIAEALCSWGKCFDSGNPKWKPDEDKILGYTTTTLISNVPNNDSVMDRISHIEKPRTHVAYACQNSSSTSTNDNQTQYEQQNNEHQKDLSWNGWQSQKQFGLELQVPWAAHLLRGEKKVETRAYPLPPKLIGKKIDILESKPGKDGISSLANVIHLKKKDENSSIRGEDVTHIGWCIFEKVIEYKNQNDFEADENRHLVERESGYGWKQGKTNIIYGWVVGQYQLYSNNSCDKMVMSPDQYAPKSLIRRMRSIFEIQYETNKPSNNTNIFNMTLQKKGKNGSKRKRRTKNCDIQETITYGKKSRKKKRY